MHRSLTSFPRRIALVIALLLTVIAPIAVSAQTPEASPAGSPVASPQLPATVTDATGAEITVENIDRIVTLNGNIAETIFALGLGGNVVATDITALYPPEAAALPKIGYQSELNAEGIIAMAPTVVIGDESAGPPEVIEQIRATGITVVILPVDETIGGPPALIRAVGQALGVADAADALATDVETDIAATAELVATAEGTPRVAFLYIRGQGTQLMAGTGTSADVVIAAAGGVNAGADAGQPGYFPVTPEALVQAAPDIILVMQAGLASVGGVEGILAIPGIAETPAGASGAIVAFEDLYLLGFGPRIGDTIFDLSLAFHPDLEGEPRNPQWQGSDFAPEADPAGSPEASPTA